MKKLRKLLAVPMILLVLIAAAGRGQSSLEGAEGASSITVSLPIDSFDTSIPPATIIVEPVITTLIDPTTTAGLNYIGFQGDFIFDSAVVSFANPSAQKAGLTSGDWNVSASIKPGPAPTPGTLKTLRLSAFSNDFTPLNGLGVLFNLRMLRVSSTQGITSSLIWRPDPQNFVYIDDNLGSHSPTEPNGLITIGTLCDLTQGFDDIGTLVPRWFMQNNSQPGPGTTGWFQGIPAVFPSQSGAPNSYNAANYDNGTGTSTLSNWLLTPRLKLLNGAQFTFWTRTMDNPAYADRLQVRMSTNAASTNMGTTATDVGDFTMVLLDINPTYALDGYPNAWTQFTVMLSGLESPTTGRLAFRYFVENGGPTGTSSDYIGIDTVQYTCNEQTPVPTPTPTPTPPPINISGTIFYCSNPVTGPVPNVTLTLAGTTSGSTSSAGNGTYTFSSLPSGGSYTVTPTKSALPPGSSGIDTVDVVTAKKHYTTGGTILSGCAATAADVTGNGVVDTADVIAIQRFFLGLSSGIANVGKYQFRPTTRTYSGVGTSQTGQNFDTLIFGDVASHFAERPAGTSPTETDDGTSAGAATATVATVALPEVAVDQSKGDFIAAVTTSAIDAKNTLVGFQGDLTFDERVVAFQSEPVKKSGMTGGDWNVSGNVLPGTGPIKTLRISAYSTNFTPLSGSGTLFELSISRVNQTAQGTQLTWAATRINSSS